MALAAPPGLHTRPMTDRVKESVFNILCHRFGPGGVLPGIDVLDLFAGSGALGVESLSRGARACLFVERDRPALRVLRANLAKLKLGSAARLSAENAWTMRIPPAEPDGYGLIFVDPPYRDVADPYRVCALLDRLAPRLSAEGALVFRHEVAIGFSAESLQTLSVVDRREFARMCVLFLQRADALGAGSVSG